MKNLSLKALALITALMLYFFVHSQTNSSVTTLVVPIEFRNLPKDRVVLLPTTQQAQVTIKGPSFLLREVVLSAPIFRIDLPASVGDRHEVSLTGADLKLPATIEIVSIVPTRIDLILDKVVTKEVLVEVPKLGVLSKNFELVKIQTDPARVKVTGPETELRGLSSVQSQPLNLASLTESQNISVNLTPVGMLSKLSTEEVQINIELKQLSLTKSFKNLPVQLQNEETVNLELLPDMVDIQVSGTPEIIEGLEADQIKLKVLVTKDKVKAGESNIDITLPEGVSVQGVSPDKIKLVIKNLNKK